MHLAEFAVRRPQFTIVIFAALVVLGGVALFRIPRAEDPVFPIARFAVVAVNPGASPHDLERLVVDPLEDKLGELTEIKAIKTTIDDGVAIIVVEFEARVDVDRKYDELLRETSNLRPTLPATLTALEVRRFSTTNVAVAQLALYSDKASYADLDARGQALRDRLRSIPNVKTVQVWGAPARQLRVSLDPSKLDQLGVPLDVVLASLHGANLTIPGGSVDIGTRKLNVETSGGFQSLNEVKETVLAARGNEILHLRDVANVTITHEDESYVTRFNGHRAVFVTVQQTAAANIFAVVDDVKRVAEVFRAELPEGMQLGIGFDQSINVGHRLGGLARDFAAAVGLVLITLLPLGLRPSLIVMISIPLSLAIGVTLLHVFGYSINQLSIVGFVIALGLLVDDSIVVTENVTRFVRSGMSRGEAAIAATREIAVPILGCTATLVIAFLPLIRLPSLSGLYIESMPAAVVLTVAASLVVSVTIVPFLASRMLVDDPGENLIFLWLHNLIELSYRPVLEWALARPKVVLVLSASLFCLSLTLLPVLGFTLFPKAGIPQFRVTVEAPVGSSFIKTERAVHHVEEVLSRRTDVSSVMANIGGGNPQIYYNVTRSEPRTNIGEVVATIAGHDGKDITRRLDSLRAELAGYSPAKLEVKEFENGLPIDAPVTVRLMGHDIDALKTMAAKVETILQHTPGAIYVGNPVATNKTDLHLTIDRDRAGLVHVQEANIERAVRMAIAGLTVSTYHEPGGDELDIVVSLAREGRQNVRTLDDVVVSAESGAQVPLAQFATSRLETSPSLIQHYNRQRAITVTAFTESGALADRVSNRVMKELEHLDWPAGVTYMAAGEIESRRESFDDVWMAILLAVGGCFVVLVLEFGTFRYTAIVASIIPMGITGGLLALLVTGYSVSFTAFVGFVALIGVDMKNSILLVDYTNRLRERGMSIDEAIRKAGETRFFPVLLTTVTAVGGLTPLAVENSSLYSPLALVLMGGLISSTLFARIVEPVMYRLLARDEKVSRSLTAR